MRVFSKICLQLFVAVAAVSLFSCEKEMDVDPTPKPAEWAKFPLLHSKVAGQEDSDFYLFRSDRYRFMLPSSSGEYVFSILNENGKLGIKSIVVIEDEIKTFDKIKEAEEYCSILCLNNRTTSKQQDGDTFIISFEPNKSGKTRKILIEWYDYFPWTLESDPFEFEQPSE